MASNILDAAIREFDELPYGTASLSNIAQRAETSKSLISYHFPTKAALGAAVVNLAYPNGIFMGDTRHSGNPIEAIVHSAEHVAERVAHGHLARVAIKLHDLPEIKIEGVPGRFSGWMGRFADYLNEAQRDGLIDPAVDVATQARLITGGMIGLITVAAGTGNSMLLVCDVSTITIDRLCALGADVDGFVSDFSEAREGVLLKAVG